MSFLDPDCNGITKEELIQGFKIARRARSKALLENRGKRVLKLVKGKLEEEGISTEQWFEATNTGKTLPGKEPVLNDRELKRGIKKLLKINVNSKMIVSFLRYADPNCDGDVSWGEFKKSLDNLEVSGGNLAATAGLTLAKFERHMQEKKIRMCDFFRLIDKDKSGYISSSELRQGIILAMRSTGPIKRKEQVVEEEKNGDVEEDEEINYPPRACTE